MFKIAQSPSKAIATALTEQKQPAKTTKVPQKGFVDEMSNGRASAIRRAQAKILGGLQVKVEDSRALVTKKYEELLGRTPEAGGLEFWAQKVDALKAKGGTDADVNQLLQEGIEGSPEYQAKVQQAAPVEGDLSVDDTALAARVDENLKGTGLAGKGSTIVMASRKYNVPIDFVMAQLQKESSFLSPENNLSVANNNPGNLRFAQWEAELGGVPGAGNFTHFPSIEKGIEAQVRLLGSDYYRADVDKRDWKSLVYKYCPPSDQPGGAADTDLYVKQMNEWTQNWQKKLGVGPSWVNEKPKAAAPAPASSSATPPRDLHGITPSQVIATQFKDQWSLCGPIAATAMAHAFGKEVSLEQVRKIGLDGGNYTLNGMLGAQSEVRMLGDLGIKAHTQDPVNWDGVKAQLAAGKPVIISTPNHYFVIEAYDPATGKFDCGNSALAMKASGGRTQMTPQDFVNWGGGAATAIVAD